MTPLLRRLAALALIAFLVILLAQFPAKWAAWLLPQPLQCEQLDGSIWNGTCTGLTYENGSVGDAGWTVHGLRLLQGRLSVDASLARAGGSISGRLEMGLWGRHEARDVVLQHLTIAHDLLPQVPRGVRAILQGRLTRLDWTGRRFSVIEGQLQVQQLRGSDGSNLGDYQLTFPPGQGATPTGELRDLGGPLEVQATLQLTAEPGFVLAGRVAARPTAAPDLVNTIQYLGSPDAQGLRPFSIAGTF